MLYSLNRTHIAAPIVELLGDMRDELIRRLMDAFTSWTVPPVQASLFGSAARGEGNNSSDIDLFIVRPVLKEGQESLWRSQIEKLARDVSHWTGNQAGISEVSEAEVARLRRTRPKVTTEIVKDGVTLFGKPLAMLLGKRR